MVRFNGFDNFPTSRYKKYLPTAFDNSLDIYEEMVILIEYVRTLNNTTNEMIEYLNKFIETFDERLYKTIDDILAKWLKDGIIDDVIWKAFNKDNSIIHIDKFPRHDGEVDDAPRINRALQYLNGKQKGHGILMFSGERYYLKTADKTNRWMVFVPNDTTLLGKAGKTQFYVDQESESGVSGIFVNRDVKNVTFKGFDVDTSCRCYVDDTSFYDPFYLRYTTKDEINVHWESIRTLGWQIQNSVNFANLDENHAKDFGYNVSLRNCNFNHMAYPTTIHNQLYENVVWNIDLDVKRPNWLEGAAQSAFKFSGKASFVTGMRMKNCVVNITGSRNPCVPYEIFRTQDAIIDGLTINNKSGKRIYVNTGTRAGSKVADYGKYDKRTTCIIKNSPINYGIHLDELSDILIENCEAKDTSNWLYSVFQEERKEAEGEGTARATVVNTRIADSVNRMCLNSKGKAIIKFDGCRIEYDRTKSPQGGFGLELNCELYVNDCEFYSNGGGLLYLFLIKDLERVVATNLRMFKGTNNSKTGYTFVVTGTGNKDLIIANVYNELQDLFSPYVRMDTGATISGVRVVPQEEVVIRDLTNNRPYKITVEGGEVKATEISAPTPSLGK